MVTELMARVFGALNKFLAPESRLTPAVAEATQARVLEGYDGAATRQTLASVLRAVKAAIISGEMSTQAATAVLTEVGIRVSSYGPPTKRRKPVDLTEVFGARPTGTTTQSVETIQAFLRRGQAKQPLRQTAELPHDL